MKPSHSLLESAVIAIFRSQQLSKEGDCLSVSVIAQEWTKTHRDADALLNTLGHMFESGLLTATAVSESVVFGLTAESARLAAIPVRRPSAVLASITGIPATRAANPRPFVSTPVVRQLHQLSANPA